MRMTLTSDTEVSFFELPSDVNDIILSYTEKCSGFIFVHFVAKSLLTHLVRGDAAKKIGKISKQRFAVKTLKLEHFNLFEWAYQQHCPVTDDYVSLQLARHGQLALLKLVQEVYPSPCVEVSCAAAETGQLEVLRWLRSKGFPMLGLSSSSSRWRCVGEVAAECGHLEVLKWLTECGDHGINEIKTTRMAAGGGHLHILKFLHQKNLLSLTAESFVAAVGSGDILTLQFLRDNHCPMIPEACQMAALKNNLPVLQWLRNGDQPCPWNWDTCASAIYADSLDVLKWILEEGHFTNKIFNLLQIIQRGSLRTFQWFIDSGNAADEPHLCKMLAQGGHLEKLKWLLNERNCKWNPEICYRASAYGHMEIVEWARQNGLPFDEGEIFTTPTYHHIIEE